MDELRLTEGEYRFAHIVWDNEPLPSALAHFMGGRAIPDTEADELKALIDRCREGDGR